MRQLVRQWRYQPPAASDRLVSMCRAPDPAAEKDRSRADSCSRLLPARLDHLLSVPQSKAMAKFARTILEGLQLRSGGRESFARLRPLFCPGLIRASERSFPCFQRAATTAPEFETTFDRKEVS